MWLLLMAACAKNPPAVEPPPVVVEEAPVEAVQAPAPARVASRAELEAADGERASLVGTVVRATPEGGEEGTAVELADGTQVFVAFGEPPHGWDWLVGTEVRVQGTVRLDPAEPPMLVDPDAPLPAGVEL